MQYSSDGSTWHDLDGEISKDGKNWNVNYDTDACGIIQDMSVWVRIRATDNNGNTSAWVVSGMFAVDNTVIVPTSISVTANLTPLSITPGIPVIVSGRAVYNTGNPVYPGTASINCNGASWTAPIDQEGNYSNAIVAPILQGSYLVSVVARDGTLQGSASVSMNVLPGSSQEGNYTLADSTPCKAVDYMYQPIDATHHFRSDDYRMWTWVHLEDVYRNGTASLIRIRLEYYDPGGHLYGDPIGYLIPESDEGGYWADYYIWGGFDIDGYDTSDLAGRWTVKIYVNEGNGYEYKRSEAFTLSYEFDQHKMSKGVQSVDPLDPISPTNTFTQNDASAYTWAQINNLSEGLEVKWDWYEPNGTRYASFPFDVPDPVDEGYLYRDWYKFWGWIDIAAESARNKCGDWYVDVFIKDPFGSWENVYRDLFKIIESPNVRPITTVTPTQGGALEGEAIFLNVTASDNTYLKKVTLYWNSGSYTWDNLNSPTFSANQNIGTYSEETPLEIYSVAEDTSGNRFESDHKTLYVTDQDSVGPEITNVSISEYDGNGNGVIESDENIRFSWDAADVNGVTRCSFYVDEVECGVTGTYESIAGPFGVGEHDYKIMAFDNDNTPAMSLQEGTIIVEYPNSTTRAALIALYNSTNGDQWLNNEGWKTPPLHTDGFAMPGTEGGWYGVSMAGIVFSLDLHGNNLSGTIPTEIGDLTDLYTALDLSNNNLTGPIPASLGRLGSLHNLLLNNNQLTGAIPPELGDMNSLVALQLQHNQLSGTLASALGNLSNLEYVLDLSANQLSGPIPASFANFHYLMSLRLNSNRLSGNIPPEIADTTYFSNIQIDIGYNALTSADPDLTAFLDAKSPGWSNTQTIPPSGVAASVSGASTVMLNWAPISYTAETGGYRVYRATVPGGPYDLYGQTSDKTVSSFQVDGLLSGQPYYFVVRTRTDAHAANLNTVDSEPSLEVSATPVLPPPGPFDLTAPGNGEVVLQDPGAAWLYLRWQASSGATSYDVYCGETPDPPRVGQDIPGTMCGVELGSPGGPYYWKVLAKGPGGETLNTGGTWNFTIQAIQIGPFDLLTPLDGAVLPKGQSVTLTWEPAENGSECWVEFGTSLPLQFMDWIWNTGSYQVQVDPGKTYYWNIQAVRDTAAGYVSRPSENGPWSFWVGQTEDLVATWDGQGCYYRDSDTGAFVRLASPATMIAAGDLEGDGIDDLIGLWPTQGGIWVKSSSTGSWARLSSTAVHIAAGDMNGDGRTDLLGTWDGQGVFYRDSVSGTWIKLATPATLITSGDIDGDRADDLIGIWPSQGGVWVKYSATGLWSRLSSTARDIAAGDMNGDGRDDLLATWDGQGVFYRNSLTGAWVRMGSQADQVTCGDLDADGIDDLIGIWPTQGGVWVKYSSTGAWARISSTARDISAGVMRVQSAEGAAPISPEGMMMAAGQAVEELPLPMGGREEGPEIARGRRDLSDLGPGGARFIFVKEQNLVPNEHSSAKTTRVPGPGEPGFIAKEQPNLFPGEQTDRPRDTVRPAKERDKKIIRRP